MRRYLILGGTGYIGKYLVEKLEKLPNIELIVTGLNADEKKSYKNIIYKRINFNTFNDFENLIKDVDVIIHLVSTILPSDNTDNICEDIKDNIFPTIRLLDALKKYDNKKIIFISSGGTVYGNHTNTPINEFEMENPISSYGIIKLFTEKYFNLYNVYYDLDYKIVRLANPYSEKIKNGKKQGIIPIIIRQILDGNTIQIWGDGEIVRDYIYMDDAIDALLAIIDYQGKERIFNVGTGKGTSINELLKIINKYIKMEININYLPGRKCDVNNNILDISKIQKETGWYPKTSLEKGILKVIEVERGQNDKDK